MTRILLIEDSSYQRSKTQHMLEASGYQVLQAVNGREGLTMATTSAPDCILLDLIMPEMGGLEVLQHLHERQLHIPVVVLTADIQGSTRQHCLELGAVAFLNKPVQMESLAEAIPLALASHAAPTGSGVSA